MQVSRRLKFDCYFPKKMQYTLSGVRFIEYKGQLLALLFDCSSGSWRTGGAEVGGPLVGNPTNAKPLL
jgi:hypothetical protein